MALKIGFSEEKIKAMKLPQLNAFVSAYNDMNSTEDKDRWATQDDIDELA